MPGRARRFCVRHTALLTGRIRGKGVGAQRVAEVLGAVGEPGPGEFCPFCERNVPDAVVREMGDTMGETIDRRPVDIRGGVRK